MSIADRYDRLPIWAQWLLGPIGIVVGGWAGLLPMSAALNRYGRIWFVPDVLEDIVYWTLAYMLAGLIQLYLCARLLPRPIIGATFLAVVIAFGFALTVLGVGLAVADAEWDLFWEGMRYPFAQAGVLYVYWHMRAEGEFAPRRPPVTVAAS